MGKCYYELRRVAARGSDSTAADMMRYMHTRQHLGKVAIICEDPVQLLSATRKQWMKISRAIQKQRASTLNADKILKHTHTITHMQQLRFTTKTPLEEPEADIYFLTTDTLHTMPIQCYSLYLTVSLSTPEAESILVQLPAEALMVDYTHGTPWRTLGLQPKKVLEDQVVTMWRHVCQFMDSEQIDIAAIQTGDIRNVEVMDDALDTLLGISHRFLNLANEFQRAMELARPLRLAKSTRQQYDTLILLAHRVQALSPGAFARHFLESYNEDDTFFLYDPQQNQSASLSELITYHFSAGRHHLANALRYVTSVR